MSPSNRDGLQLGASESAGLHLTPQETHAPLALTADLHLPAPPCRPSSSTTDDPAMKAYYYDNLEYGCLYHRLRVLGFN